MKSFLLRGFWHEGRWQPLAWICGMVVGALWVYSGMPMICH